MADAQIIPSSKLIVNKDEQFNISAENQTVVSNAFNNVNSQSILVLSMQVGKGRKPLTAMLWIVS